MADISEYIPIKRHSFKPDGSRWPDLFGLEFELENVENAQNLPYWQIKEDNSLRNGIEYVLDRPYAGATLELALDAFYGAKLITKNTARTSTHIHVNVSDCDVDVIRSMIVIMYTIEDALFNVVGEGRKWSGYAMALSEMDPLRLRRAFRDDREDILLSFNPGRNQERYYGFNFMCGRHGTVEFRYFPGGPHRKELESWIDLVHYVKQAALKQKPIDIVDKIQSVGDLVNWLEDNLGHEWTVRFLKDGNPEAMFAKFNEIAAYVTDADAIERREQLVFIHPSYIKFLGKRILSEAGVEYVEKIRKEFGAVTQGDWHYYLSEAQRLGPVKVELPKRRARPNMKFLDAAPTEPRAEDDYPDEDHYEDDVTVPEVAPPRPAIREQGAAPVIQNRYRADAFWQPVGEVNPWEAPVPEAVRAADRIRAMQEQQRLELDRQRREEERRRAIEFYENLNRNRDQGF